LTEELPARVIGLDQIRIARGMGKICKCENRTFVIDTDNRRVTCGGCSAVVDPYDALYELAYNDERRTRDVERLMEQRKEIASYKPWLVVIKSLESHYRGHKMLPYCPRCSEPFYLEEIVGWVARDYADARIKQFKKEHPRE